MQYRNKMTGAVIEVNGRISGPAWEELTPPPAPAKEAPKTETTARKAAAKPAAKKPATRKKTGA